MESYHAIECPILSCLYAAGISIICIVKHTRNITSDNYIPREKKRQLMAKFALDKTSTKYFIINRPLSNNCPKIIGSFSLAGYECTRVYKQQTNHLMRKLLFYFSGYLSLRMIAIHPPSFFMDVRPVIEQPELQVIF
jgi:hypothetical protein